MTYFIKSKRYIKEVTTKDENIGINENIKCQKYGNIGIDKNKLK